MTRADDVRSSNYHQVEAAVLLPDVIAVTNTGVTPIIISKERKRQDSCGRSQSDRLQSWSVEEQPKQIRSNAYC